MEIYRCSAAVLLALVCLACAPQSAQEGAEPAAAEVAPIAREIIEHVLPKRDFVGPAPARFEWTAAQGAVDYAVTVENEVDMLLFEARLSGTALDWPTGNKLAPGTYFWRVVGLAADGRRVADSGRAAFVVADAAQ